MMYLKTHYVLKSGEGVVADPFAPNHCELIADVDISQGKGKLVFGQETKFFKMFSVPFGSVFLRARSVIIDATAGAV